MSEFIEKLRGPRVVKVSILIAFVVFLPSLIIAMILATTYGGTRIGPGEFSIFTNFISDLGSVRYTPAPFILDIIAMITAFLLAPIFLYFKKDFDEAPLRSRDMLPIFVKISKFLAFFFLAVACIGFFGIGLFSEDRSFDLYLHEIFSVTVWGGFGVAALFLGIVAIYKDVLFSKLVGFFMIFAPTPATIAYVILYLERSPLRYIFEWILLFFIFIWMIPFSLKLIKQLNSEK